MGCLAHQSQTVSLMVGNTFVVARTMSKMIRTAPSAIRIQCIAVMLDYTQLAPGEHHKGHCEGGSKGEFDQLVHSSS